MKHVKLAVAAGAALAAAAILTVALRQPKGVEMEPTSSAPRPTKPTVELVPLATDQGVPVALPEDDGEHGEFTTSTDIYKQRLFRNEPELAQFDAFREQVLQDVASREAYHKLLADKEMVTRTKDELLHPKYEKDTMETNVKRLMQIDYLRESLAWKDNPARADVIDMVATVIAEDAFAAGMPGDVKRSLAATKMELFQILSGHDAALVQKLVEKAQGTRVEAMLKYFAESNQRRIEKERELSLQAKAPSP